MPVDFTYSLPMPVPSSEQQSPITRRIHRNSVTRSRTPSPSIPPDFVSANPALRARYATGPVKSRQKRNTTADDITRLLDPSYANYSSPSIVGTPFAPANSNSNGTFMYLDSQGDLHDPDYRPFPVLRSSFLKAGTNRAAHRPKVSPGSSFGEDDLSNDNDNDKHPRGRQSDRIRAQRPSYMTSSTDNTVQGVTPSPRAPGSKAYSYLSVSSSYRSPSPNSRWSETIPSLVNSATDTGPFYSASPLRTAGLLPPAGTRSPPSSPGSCLTADGTPLSMCLSERDDLTFQQPAVSPSLSTLTPARSDSLVFAAERNLVASERAFAALSSLSAGNAGDRATAKRGKEMAKKVQTGLRDASAAQDKEEKATAKEEDRVVQQDIRAMKVDVKAMAKDDKTVAKQERAMVKCDRAVARDVASTHKEDAAFAQGGKAVRDKVRKDGKKVARNIANAAGHLHLGRSQDANRAQHVQLEAAQENAALGVLERAAKKVRAVPPPDSSSSKAGWASSLSKHFHSIKEDDAPEPSMLSSGHYANEPRAAPVSRHISETPDVSTPSSADHSRVAPSHDHSLPRQYRAVKQRVQFMAFRMNRRVRQSSS
ncbi:hypothetical protein PLICRDRAFT_43353 [Plicaturopsis crispa FD-325 SS-3]|nr:hypothetical protein PLICRDRAFT_43353 [Plicaturopsis crispa FD-325 SS-3]